MDADAVREMLDEDRQEWQALCAALDAHPDGPLHDPESPEWTSRDVYAHLARWMEHSTAAFQSWLANRTIPKGPEGDDDEINARWQAEDSGLTLDEARARAQRAFGTRIAAIEAAPPDRWDEVLEATARADAAGHYRDHRSYIATLA